MTLLLVRHGETDAIGKLLAGRQPGWSLNSTGKVQIEKVVKQLSAEGIQALYSSPVERCLETAKLLSISLGLAPVVKDGLAEVDFGDWEGHSFESLNKRERWREFNRIRSTTHPPGGERMIDVQNRMIREIDEIRYRHEGETVAVISHGDPIRVSIAYYLGVSLDLMQRFAIGLASVSAIRFNGNQPLLLYLNRSYEY